MTVEVSQWARPSASLIEEIARNCRLLPQNLANWIDDFRPIRESPQWLGNSSRTTNPEFRPKAPSEFILAHHLWPTIGKLEPNSRKLGDGNLSPISGKPRTLKPKFVSQINGGGFALTYTPEWETIEQALERALERRLGGLVLSYSTCDFEAAQRATP